MHLPSYLNLYKSGELARRIAFLNNKLVACDICPHHCGINRYDENSGICRSFQHAYVCSYCDHHGEEPPLSGTMGSGTIFFGNCNLHCVFCQNHDISQHLINSDHYTCNSENLARIMIDLQDNRNCHNINFVSPSHFVPQILEAVNKAISLGLKIPLIYNSNGYDEVGTLKQLDGVIDIYLPDLKYANDENAKKYSGITDYVSTARAALKEMYHQVGLLKMNSQEIAITGLIVRHLVLPNDIAGTKECLHWIARELSPEVTISLMAQYYPANIANEFPEINRSLESIEYYEALKTLKELGFCNALYQETLAAHIYKPNFKNKEDPFVDQ